MNFNELKRKTFFWIEKLQISRSERISIAVLMGILGILLASSFFLNRTFNFNQEEYDEIVAEFERRSALIEEEKKELEAKYDPAATVSESQNPGAGIPAEDEINEPATAEKININTATSAQLQSLHGIGETYAQRIIEYRENNGGFDSIDELINVRGIGKTRLENIRPHITLDD